MKYQNFSSESFHYLVVKFSIYLNWGVFIMCSFLLQKSHNIDTIYNKHKDLILLTATMPTQMPTLENDPCAAPAC